MTDRKHIGMPLFTAALLSLPVLIAGSNFLFG
jgi:hypothetical protein